MSATLATGSSVLAAGTLLQIGVVTPQMVLVGLRLLLFGLALGLTIISFLAYRRRRDARLEYAFIGFAFISMGVAVTTLRTMSETEGFNPIFGYGETIPFIIGFVMLYASLYR